MATTQYIDSIIEAQQKALATVREQLAVVHTAVENSNKVLFDAVQESLDTARDDLQQLTGDERPSAKDLTARASDRASAWMSAQEKVAREMASAWSPVVERITADVTSWTSQATEAASKARGSAS